MPRRHLRSAGWRQRSAGPRLRRGRRSAAVHWSRPRGPEVPRQPSTSATTPGAPRVGGVVQLVAGHEPHAHTVVRRFLEQALQAIVGALRHPDLPGALGLDRLENRVDAVDDQQAIRLTGHQANSQRFCYIAGKEGGHHEGQPRHRRRARRDALRTATLRAGPLRQRRVTGTSRTGRRRRTGVRRIDGRPIRDGRQGHSAQMLHRLRRWPQR